MVGTHQKVLPSQAHQTWREASFSRQQLCEMATPTGLPGPSSPPTPKTCETAHGQSSLFHNNGTFDIFSIRPIAIVLFALKETNLPCCLLLIYLFLPDVTKKTLESLEGQGQSLRGGAREVQSWIRAGVRGSCHSSPGPRDQRLQAGIGPCGSSGPSQNKLSPSFTLSLFCRIQKWKGLETPMRNI